MLGSTGERHDEGGEIEDDNWKAYIGDEAREKKLGGANEVLNLFKGKRCIEQQNAQQNHGNRQGGHLSKA